MDTLSDCVDLSSARGRDLGRQGQETLRRLLDAGLAEFCEKGFQAVRVEDVAQRARTSHGTFYLYFENKEDLFASLVRDALAEMRELSGDFPIVTANDAGRAALRSWVRRFCAVYATHASVIRILSQAEVVSDEIWKSGLSVLFGLAENLAQGMTAAAFFDGGAPATTELTAIACVMMLERVNYLLSAGITIPPEQITEQITTIILAAFPTS